MLGDKSIVTKIIAISNQKGGVGKTTTTVNLATALAIIGNKILLIDLDPQGNASTSLGIKNPMRKKNIYQVMSEGFGINSCIALTEIPNLEIIPSIVDLAVIEKSPDQKRNSILKEQISKLENRYHYILIDCSPSLGTLTINALTAATSVLIPVQCEFLAMEGLAHLLNTLNLIKNTTNKRLYINGIILVMTERRKNLCIQVEEEIRREFSDLVYETTIPRNIKLAEAPSYGKPALLYDTKCSGSISYMMLTKEFLSRDKNSLYLSSQNLKNGINI